MSNIKKETLPSFESALNKARTDFERAMQSEVILCSKDSSAQGTWIKMPTNPSEEIVDISELTSNSPAESYLSGEQV